MLFTIFWPSLKSFLISSNNDFALKVENLLLDHEEKFEALVSAYAKENLALQKSLHDPPSPPSPDQDRTSAFEKIFDSNYWGSEESRSGKGSSLEVTANARNFISTMWKIFNTKSFLDSPCGDCNWQSSIPGIEHINYTGVDIVPAAIKHNIVKYFKKSNMRFAVLDLVEEGEHLPKNEFDIVMCRDAIQHLPLSDGMKIYQSLEATGAKLLITNIHLPNDHPNTKGVNLDIQPGGYYDNNPLLEPFKFGLPIFYTYDTFASPGNDKYMAAFELPIIGKGDGTFDLNLFDIIKSRDQIVPIGERGRQLWEEYLQSQEN
ncbi:hypothetical protein HK096_003278 [Nowakowskiella sp. JEL0078]|nr:hypothetical protein HK096_003278 [Nowakowskiella sp. JEL0078]